MTTSLKFQVNGKSAQVKVEPSTPLLYVLRNDLGLKGAKFGCGTGHCGACTVMIDGRAVQSCDVPVWAAVDKEVTTVEGLSSDTDQYQIQQIFLDRQAAQCGYCVNGILMEIRGLLNSDSQPTESALLKALDRHLCRCGTHVRILAAARQIVARSRRWD